MKKNSRFVLIIGLLAVTVFCLLAFGIADDDTETSADTHVLNPPIGLVAKADLTSVELFWTNSSDFNAKVEGFYVYYWQRDNDFQTIQPVNDKLIIEEHCKIDNLRPNTQYSFVVRAATKQQNESLERQGDLYLSKFSKEYLISTLPDTKIELLMSNVEGGLFKVMKYLPRKNKWFEDKFFAKLGGDIGSVRKIDDIEIDFRTGYVLKKMQMKTIPKETPKTTKFNDPRDPAIEITVPNKASNEKSAIVYEAVLIDTNGKRIILSKDG